MRYLSGIVVGSACGEELRYDALWESHMLVYCTPVVVNLHALVVQQGCAVTVPVRQVRATRQHRCLQLTSFWGERGGGGRDTHKPSPLSECPAYVHAGGSTPKEKPHSARELHVTRYVGHQILHVHGNACIVSHRLSQGGQRSCRSAARGYPVQNAIL